ncbi:sialin-like [Pollicipes pollicipes]|uniref:sialin-like n=1 Tax=Pollicipes pollicipes TaxID=41117 RepID=UPI001885566C|nr:sialin-like [Pollicipes pollicipes]
MSTRIAEASKQVEAEVLKYRLVPSTRLLVILMTGLGAGTVMINRYNVSIAVVCMVADVEPPSVSIRDDPWNASHPREQMGGTGNASSTAGLKEGQGEFHWDKTFQGLLLSSYFYGYTAALAPGGWVADRLPAQLVLMFGVVTQAVATLLFPIVARTKDYLLLALRAAQGFTCSVVLPASVVLIRNWSIPDEYSTLFSIAWSLQYIFAGFSFPISSSLCEYGGWPFVFYVTGALPLAWVLVAWFLVPTCPDESRLCSEDEQRFLTSHRLCRVATIKSLSDKQVKPVPTPLLAIVTNRQVLIIVGTFFFYHWFYYSLNITLPTFLKETMNVDLTENGLLSGLPTLFSSIGVVLGGRLLQYLTTRWQFSRTTSRKLIASFAMLVPAGLLGAMLVLPSGNTYTTMALICLSNAIIVLNVSGGPLSAGPDLGPQFAGVIWGLAGSVGNLTGVLTPMVAAAMTPHKTLLEWRYFFLIAVVFLVAMDFVIVLFWKSELQPFARTDDTPPQPSVRSHEDDPHEDSPQISCSDDV